MRAAPRRFPQVHRDEPGAPHDRRLHRADERQRPGKLSLRLELPLKDLPKTRVAGEYEFDGNELIVNPQLPPIEAAAGKIAFTESTLTVAGVQGRLFGGPVAVTGATQGDGTVQVVARGEATLAGTRALFDHPLRRFFAGQAASPR